MLSHSIVQIKILTYIYILRIYTYSCILHVTLFIIHIYRRVSSVIFLMREAEKMRWVDEDCYRENGRLHEKNINKFLSIEPTDS